MARQCVLPVLAAASLWGACAHQRSPSVVRIVPEATRPGMALRVTVDGPLPKDPGAIVVRVGDVPAPHVARVGTDELYVITPEVQLGSQPVAVAVGDRRPGRTLAARILPPAFLRLHLKLESGQLDLLAATPTGGGSEDAGSDGPRLSVDVIDAHGVVAWTGSLVHPLLGRGERYFPDADGQTRFEPLPATTRGGVTIDIPFALRDGLVRVYEVDAGVDLGTDGGRAARRLLAELRVSP